MKSYIDYINEISQEDLFEGLLGYGMFAEKIPKIFSGEEFLSYCKLHSPLGFEKTYHEYVQYRSMRNTHVLRYFAIPNPVAYAYLCICLRDNWSQNIVPYFRSVTESQEFCYSQIHIQKSDVDKALFRMNISYHERDEQTDAYCERQKIGKHYKVTTDISNCYPSIYSHVLAWALVGKTQAKATQGNDLYWYNQLDMCNRYTKNNETNGLHIGPHAYGLLAEIVLTRVDKHMQDLGYQYIRHIDDCVFYAETHEKAQKFILDFGKVLSEYDLKINEKKTRIEELPLREEDWVTQLLCFHFGSEKTDTGKIILRKNRLSAFMNLSKKLAFESGNLSVYLYAIKMLKDVYLGRRAKDYLLNEVHQLLLNYTYLVPYMEDYIFDTFAINQDNIKYISENLFKEGVKTNNYEACSYALYWALRYKFSLSAMGEYAEIFKIVQECNDCVFMLLAYLHAKGDNDKALMKKYKEFAASITDVDRFWYFIYEVLPKEQLPQSEMRTLKNAKVSFIKPEYK